MNDWELLNADPECTPEAPKYARNYTDVVRDVAIVTIDVSLFSLKIVGAILNLGEYFIQGSKVLNNSMTHSGTALRSYLSPKVDKCLKCEYTKN